ncbi:MAG: amino acid permease [Bacteroidales bacterium]
MASSLFSRKPIDILINESQDDGHGLKRALGKLNLITLGIGAIIGAGIFVLAGEVSASYSGPAIIISFVIAAFACACAGLCYAEMAAMIPIAGSAYTYSYATVGRFFAWFVAWVLIIEYLFAASTVSVGWSGYIVSFLHGVGIDLPKALVTAPIAYDTTLDQFVRTGGIINIPAVFIILMITILLIIGIRESANFNNIIVVIKLTVIVVFLLAGVAFVNKANWTPFIPENTGTFGQFGWSGILRGAAVIFFAYIGFDAVSTAAQEAKNPQRDLPIGILGSLFICTILYILVALVLTGLVSYTKLGVPDPIAVGVDALNMPWLSWIIKLGAIAGLTSVILVMLLGQPRIFYTMAKDGLLPPVFTKVHSKFKTPHISSMITGGIAMLLAGMFPIGVLSKLVSFGTLLAFSMVCLAILILRKTRPEIHRPFRTPWSPVIPILGIISCLAQIAFLNIYAWKFMAIWLAIGLIIYMLYGRTHAKY